MKTKEIINSYLEYLQFERGLSGNTLLAYERDLYKFSEITGKNPLKSGAEEVSELLRHMHKSGQSAKSQSRILSALRGFYNWAQEEELVETNPTALFENPRDARSLPVVLSEKEVQKLLDIIPLDGQFSTRDKAIIELLYACGLRVSEACGLKRSLLRLRRRLLNRNWKGK